MTDIYDITLPSGERMTLIVPSPLTDEDRAVLQSIVDMIPRQAEAKETAKE